MPCLFVFVNRYKNIDLSNSNPKNNAVVSDLVSLRCAGRGTRPSSMKFKPSGLSRKQTSFLPSMAWTIFTLQLCNLPSKKNKGNPIEQSILQFMCICFGGTIRIFVAACRQIYRRLFCLACRSHAKHVREQTHTEQFTTQTAEIICCLHVNGEQMLI